MSAGGESGLMVWVSAATAIVAAGILVMHLVRRREDAPNPDGFALVKRSTKLWLLFGLGILPLTSAGAANVSGFAATQGRTFCGSCHVMEPHANDSVDPSSHSLAAIHARNESFGRDNCYACHKDYGMYGYVLTKAGGMRHVYLYLTEFRKMPLEESRGAIRIRAPVPNSSCMHCHSTTAPRWLSVGDHASSLDAVRNGTLGCASPGCHGYAHPITKLGRELDRMGPPPIPADAGSER